MTVGSVFFRYHSRLLFSKSWTLLFGECWRMRFFILRMPDRQACLLAVLDQVSEQAGWKAI